MTTYGPRHARRTDDNHSETTRALRDVPGVYVQDVSRAGGLGFDLIVSYQDSPPHLVEIKRPKDPAPLSPSEQRARAHWGKWWIVATSAVDVLERIGAIENQETQ